MAELFNRVTSLRCIDGKTYGHSPDTLLSQLKDVVPFFYKYYFRNTTFFG